MKREEWKHGSTENLRLPKKTHESNPVAAHLVDGFLHLRVDAQIDHGVGEGAAHVVFHGDVVYTLQGHRIFFQVACDHMECTGETQKKFMQHQTTSWSASKHSQATTIACGIAAKCIL